MEISWLGECAWVCGIVGTFCVSFLGVDVKKDGILNGAWARGGGTGSSRRVGCLKLVEKVTVGICTDGVGMTGGGAWAVPRRTLSLYNRSVDWLELLVSLSWCNWEEIWFKASCLYIWFDGFEST